MLTSGIYNGKCKTLRKDVTFWSVPSPVMYIYIYMCVCVISFTVNGTQHTVTNPDPAMNLNEWIRNQPGLQGKSHIELNIIFGKSHTTALIFLVLFFNREKKCYLK